MLITTKQQNTDLEQDKIWVASLCSCCFSLACICIEHLIDAKKHYLCPI